MFLYYCDMYYFIVYIFINFTYILIIFSYINLPNLLINCFIVYILLIIHLLMEFLIKYVQDLDLIIIIYLNFTLVFIFRPVFVYLRK
jgi:hypothetical protein